ncbi:LysR family transcriptional regulator [Shewanella sp. WXL01]|uniref:LysR family transcriptional regulator n=1 Tax=Shewanella sp. WXL01 TaxID=2709721 RepID=UPI00143848F5|nr:LysR family transcriptional regulator [Shewanella sp. WXL01]NKF50763.1 LysR family transcriptional regulator [Shewanella sp. WXL01]
MLNIEQLNAFVAAAEKGSFSAAARHIGKSQSSVSISVNNLELDLGISLFDRSTKYPTLTVQGERLYQQAKILLRQAERMESYALGVNEEVENTLVIGIDSLAPLALIEAPLEKLGQKFPFTNVKLIKLANNQLANAVHSGEIQVAMMFPDEGVPEHLDFLSCMNVEWVCVCSPDSSFADMDVVDNETLISHRQVICSGLMDNSVMRTQSILSQDVWEASDQDDVVRLIEQDIGWGFIPQAMLGDRQALGTLNVFKPEFNLAPMINSLDICWRTNIQHGPAAQFFIDQITELGSKQ